MTKYNGWANWATWKASLWFSNTEILQRGMEEIAADLRRKHFSDPSLRVEMLAKAMLDEVNAEIDREVLLWYSDQGLPRHPLTELLVDLLRHQANEIDFQELARSYLEVDDGANRGAGEATPDGDPHERGTER